MATGQVAAGVMRYAQSLVEQHKRHTLRKFEHKYTFQVWAQTHSGIHTIHVLFLIFNDKIENDLHIFIQIELFVHTIPYLGKFLVGCESFYLLALKVRGGRGSKV